MKLSKALSELTKIFDQQGDIEMKCYPYDGQMNPVEMNSIAVCDTKVIAWNQEKKEWDKVPCPNFVLMDNE